jgi:hypothetical protein
MSGIQPVLQDFKIGDSIKIFIGEDEHLSEVEMIGNDNCDFQHPIWEVISGPCKGQRVSCADVTYI